MTLNEIKENIKLLAAKHQSIDENDLDAFDDADLIELRAEKIIINYCEQQKYLVNGFPTEKKKIEDELEEDYFCRERYQLYLDILLVEKEDVAELMWCFTSNFWPDSFESKEYYIQCIKEQLESGVFYDVDLD
jgi:hypothetical protein